MTVYADLYVIVNAAMDFAALFAVSMILRLPRRRLRLFGAALLGGGYALAALWLPEGWLSLLTGAIMGVLLCRIGLKTRSAGQFFLGCGLFLALSMLLGGMVTSLYSMLGAADILIPAGEEALLLLLPLAAAVAGGAKYLFRRTVTDRRRQSAEASFSIGGQTVTVVGLLDTGNLLREPLSGRAVLILAGDAADFLPAGIPPEKWITSPDLLPPALREKLRILPVNGFGGKRLLPGFLCDEATVDGKKMALCVGIDGINRRYGGMKAILPGGIR